MNDKQRTMLKSIEHTPRLPRYFTEGMNQLTAPNVADLYLKRLVEQGFIEFIDGMYHITAIGKEELAIEPVKSPQYGNASMKTQYFPPSWQFARPGAGDALLIQSRGQAC